MICTITKLVRTINRHIEKYSLSLLFFGENLHINLTNIKSIKIGKLIVLYIIKHLNYAPEIEWLVFVPKQPVKLGTPHSFVPNLTLKIRSP